MQAAAGVVFCCVRQSAVRLLPILIEAVHRIAGVVFGVQLAIARLVVEKIEIVTETGYVVGRLLVAAPNAGRARSARGIFPDATGTGPAVKGQAPTVFRTRGCRALTAGSGPCWAGAVW